MENAMPPEDRSEQFGDFDAQLASLRAAAKSLRDERPSWFEHIFHPGRQARRQADINGAVVAALKEMGATIRKMTANFSERERHLSNLETELAQLRERQDRFAPQSAVSSLIAVGLRRQLRYTTLDLEAKSEKLIPLAGLFCMETSRR